MRAALALIALPALAACVALTPQQQCIRQVPGGAELATIRDLIRVTEGNINRGYAIAEVTDVRTRRTRCEGTNEDGSTFRFPCEETETFERREPVAISVADERVKLSELRARESVLRPRIDAGIAQCRATYPE